ncbi:MAG TPA: M20/M25/M40 family metallo-hydrolase [Phycisphaerae bacterium]|nr:M20/M25/M40 family metallo-hydrolase [Phycisphaerae bacterium]HOI53914.1 M20/M25/M40 family metallo-hydrolase [Phycisphaerae bacterium]
MNDAQLSTVLDSLRGDVRDLLCRLIEVPSTRGGEGPALALMREALARCTDEARDVPIPESIQDDRDFAFKLPGVTYADRPNVMAVRRGAGRGPTVFLNTHLDVVPPSVGQADPYKPRVDGDTIYGRGACDAKGQAATIFAVMRALDALGVRLPGTVECHLVVEEENGGNGTLAMIRHVEAARGKRCADGCLVLEPSNLRLMPSVRGAVWFQLKVYGRPGHSGTPGSSVSALKKAVVAMAALEAYHDRLLAASRGNPLFDAFANPMPVTFGVCEAGNWPAAAPSEAVLKGVFGFLPPKSRHEVQQEMAAVLKDCGDEWLSEHFELTFPMLNSDGNELDPGHPLVASLKQSLAASGVEPQLSALTGSCDAWFYANQLEIPTVVFGPGDLGTAHGKDEQVRVSAILKAAEVIVRTIAQLNGLEM